MNRLELKTKTKIAAITALILCFVALFNAIIDFIHSGQSLYNTTCQMFGGCQKKKLNVDYFISDYDYAHLVGQELIDYKLSNNIVSINDDTISIIPASRAISNTLPHQQTHATNWHPNYPIIDITVSPTELGNLNLSNIIFELSEKSKGVNHTPYVSVDDWGYSFSTLALYDQSWTDIESLEIFASMTDCIGDLDSVNYCLQNIKPNEVDFDLNYQISKPFNNSVSFTTIELSHCVGDCPPSYSKEDFICQPQFVNGKIKNCDVYQGVVGKIVALASTENNDTYTSYFSNTITLRTDAGWGDGDIPINSNRLVKFESDLHKVQFPIPISYRFSEEKDVYRAHYIITSDKSAHYSFRFKLVGNGEVLYTSNWINADIIVPRHNSGSLVEKIYQQ